MLKRKLLPAALLLSLLGGCQQGTAEQADGTMKAQAKGTGMEDERRVAIVREMADAWKRRDWNKVAAMFAEDGVLHSMMVEPVRGRQAIGQRISALGAGIESISLNFRNIGVVDDVVFVERVDEFVYKGKKGSVPVAGVIEIRPDGLISEWREYYDRAELLEEMGIEQDFDQAGRS